MKKSTIRYTVKSLGLMFSEKQAYLWI